MNPITLTIDHLLGKPSPITLELQRLAWMDKHFDEMIEAALRRDDEGFNEAKAAFYNSTRDGGKANNLPPSNQ